MVTKFPIWICNGVFSSSIAFKREPIFPSCVLFPIAVTSQIAKPEATIVPWKTCLFSDSFDLNTAKDSPVKIDSFTEKSLDERIIPSAGMNAPSANWTQSPMTISSVGLSIVEPFRMTLHFGWVSF